VVVIIFSGGNINTEGKNVEGLLFADREGDGGWNWRELPRKRSAS
jgi:hypothetical protein